MATAIKIQVAGLEKSEVMPDAHGAQAHVEIRETDPEQTDPCPKHVAAVEAAHTGITPGAGRRFGRFIQEPADQMPQGMAAQCVAAEKKNVQREHKSPDADAEMFYAAVHKPQGFPNVVRENEQEQQPKVEEVTVDVLHDERKGPFTEKNLARLADGARRRVGPKRLVIGAAVIIAGESKTRRRPQNQQRR